MSALSPGDKSRTSYTNEPSEERLEVLVSFLVECCERLGIVDGLEVRDEPNGRQNNGKSSHTLTARRRSCGRHGGQNHDGGAE